MTKRLASTRTAASRFVGAVLRRARKDHPEDPRRRRPRYGRVRLAGLGMARLSQAALSRVRGPGVARLREAGMTTAEYAIGTLAACGFAALLVTILRGSVVQGLLLAIIKRALAMGS